MTTATFSTSIEAQQAAALLEGYRFEMGSHDARQWVSLWLDFYRPAWIRDAVVEALYQGRYKSISVRQILELWNRRGQPIRHVTHEFEAAVCREFGEVKLVAAPRSRSRSNKVNTGSIRRNNKPSSSTNRHNQVALHPSSLRDSIRQAGQAGFGPSAAVSFDLSATPPGMEKVTATENNIKTTPEIETTPESRPPQATELKVNSTLNNGNESYRKVSRSAIQSPAETEALLRTQQQLNGVLYTSARAIQPFKPALPFSAQTLRLARQKALA